MNQISDEQIKAVEEASGHSVFGGSSLPRIVACPASVGESLKAGLKPDSIYAQKGTVLHGWMEKSRRATDPSKYLLSQKIDIEDTVLLMDATDYVDQVINLHPDGSYDLELEATGSLGSYGLPEVYGTKDVRIESEHRVDVIDYKFGYGVSVYAENNYQLGAYLGMAVPYIEVPSNTKELFVHICQPPKNIYDVWQVDYETLYDMILRDITNAISNARSANPRFGPSKKACQFCAANMNCVPRHKYLREQQALVQSMSKNPSMIPNEQWALFLKGWPALKAAASHVEKYAMSEIMSGRDFPGFKLVSGRANRKFKDKEAGEGFIASKLGSKAYKAAPMVTLAQAEKIDPSLKKSNEWKDLIYKPSGAPKLVKEDAKGTAMSFGVRSVMDDIAGGKIER